jgi:hypothetical protein
MEKTSFGIAQANLDSKRAAKVATLAVSRANGVPGCFPFVPYWLSIPLFIFANFGSSLSH